MPKRTGLRLRPRSCKRCGGDVYLEVSAEEDWRCLQCGRLVELAVASAPEAEAALEQAA
jgi:PHP family Zn ribbon phosphoesterase